MEERHRKILKKKYGVLTRDLKPDDVMRYLIQEDILEFDDLSMVRAQPTTPLQVEKLLSIVVSRGPKAFYVFLEALKDRYKWLYDDLKKADEESRGQRQFTESYYGEKAAHGVKNLASGMAAMKVDNPIASPSDAWYPIRKTIRPSSSTQTRRPGQEAFSKQPSKPAAQTKANESNTAKKAVIKKSEMPDNMEQDAVCTAIKAMERYEIAKDVAAFIKKEFDRKHNRTWHCIVVTEYGSKVTHSGNNFIYFYVGDLAVMLFKMPEDSDSD